MLNRKQLDNVKSINELDKILVKDGYKSRCNGSSHKVYSADNKPSVCVPIKKGGNIAPGTKRDILKILLGESYYAK